MQAYLPIPLDCPSGAMSCMDLPVLIFDVAVMIEEDEGHYTSTSRSIFVMVVSFTHYYPG